MLVWGIVATPDPRQCIMEPQQCFPRGGGRCSWVPAVSLSRPGCVASALCGDPRACRPGIRPTGPAMVLGRKSEEQRQEKDCPEGRSSYDVHGPLGQGGGRAGMARGGSSPQGQQAQGERAFWDWAWADYLSGSREQSKVKETRKGRIQPLPLGCRVVGM